MEVSADGWQVTDAAPDMLAFAELTAEAVMVAEPPSAVARQLTRPVADTVATDVLLLPHVTLEGV